LQAATPTRAEALAELEQVFALIEAQRRGPVEILKIDAIQKVPTAN
jgi:hypothetical protein